MPHKILECEDIEKKTTYHPRDPISTLFSAVKENIKFTNITRTSYTQDQAVNIVYVIIHRTGKFRLVICKWNLTTTVQRTWVRFKQFFWKLHQELQETSNLTVEDSSMHHTDMVRNVVAELQEVLQKEQSLTENATTVPKPVDHVETRCKATIKI